MHHEGNPANTLPPNQQLVAPGKWPVVGEKAPRQSEAPWRVSTGGLVAAPKSWSLDEIRQMPQVEQAVDIHCVTRWSRLGARFAGVPLASLLERCAPLPEARFVVFTARSDRSHSTSLPLQDALALQTLVALRFEGAPLESIHGGPVRTVVPGRYFYKSLKWLETITLLSEDRPGYWERVAGYHNVADPWREERYIAPDLDRRVLRRALDARDFSHQDLRSLDARGRDLSRLDARHALLRDAKFQNVNLERACFEHANLSNAHLEGASLRDASFVQADVEGADFRGADLRGADFTGASLFGATFCPEEQASDGGFGPARLDRTTRIQEEALEKLTPRQQEFVRRQLNHH
jgi:DMSO/TMAO reductase YedYZ molybdopterin-dependent catalytic subunit